MKKLILLGLFTLLSVFSARAYDFEVNGIYYNIISDTSVEVTSSGRSTGKYSESVVIPAMVEYDGNFYSVTAIGYGAFYGCTLLNSVRIPEGVTSIGYEAFKNCFGLSSVTIPESVDTVGDNAFYNCNRTRGPLYNSKIFAHMPQDYSGEYVIPSSIQLIAGGAFYECFGLISVTIPESVTSIGSSAFSGCSGLTSVTLPESVTSIGSSAFSDCSGLTSVTISESVTSIEGYAFSGCSGLTSVTIPNSVTSIGWHAFSGCSSLTSVTIPEGVTNIGECAFDACTQLKRMEWNAVNCRIDNDEVFSRENNITIIIFGKQVECIPSYLCYGWDKLTSATIPESVDTIGNFAFFGCTSISSPLYNSKVFAYMPQNYSGEYVIPSGIQSIAGAAFYKCIGLTSVTIPESVTTIEAFTFEGCSGLRTVTVPESVTTIGACAFEDCIGLTSVTIPASVTAIGNSAFQNCDGLTSVTIPNSVTFIGGYAFADCFGLTSVTIGESVTTIEERAFYYCWHLASVTSLAENPPYCGSSYNKGVFSDYYATLYVPHGCKEVYQSAQEWSEFSRIEELPNAGTAMVNVNVNDASMGRVDGGGEYELDEEITIKAFPNIGYHFVKWHDGNTDNPRTLTVTGDITLTAEFAPNLYMVTLSVNDESAGSVTGGGEYAFGSQAMLEAIPNQGYHFVRWNDGNTDNPREVTVICDIVLTAIFAKNSLTANEASLAAAPFAYVQGRTVYLSDNLGEVEAFTATGQRVYRGFDRTITLLHPGVYILRVVADGRRSKVIVK